MRSLFFLLACLGVSAAQLPEQPSVEELSVPALRVTTRLVLADVIVTNKSGKREKGLTKEDFTVLDNGKPQKIAAVSIENGEVFFRQALFPLPRLVSDN